MQTENQFESPYEGPKIEGDDINYHVIVTTHPYMSEIGLSAFTTGQLYEWMTKTNSKGEYTNLKIFGVNKTIDPNSKESLSFEDFADTAEKILGLTKPNLTDKKHQRFNFDAWRFYDDGAGEYVKYYNTLMSTSNWKYKKYGWKDLKLEDFDQKTVETPNFDINPENGYPQINLAPQNNLDNFVSNLIEMNNYVRYRTMSTIKSKWEDIDKVRSEFSLDVKSSFQKCVEWSGIVPFTLNLNAKTEGSGSVENGCVKEEWVSYKLFLFDDNLPKENARKVTLSELVYVAPKIDSFGRVGNKSNGELTAVSRDINPKSSTAGSLDLQWNEFEGKWQSGTPQVIAILTTNIAAAKLPNLESITQDTVSSLIGRNLVVPIGSAIPLNMQNGNPYQIGPDFNLSKDCRNGNNDKYQVRIYNRVPRPWASGEVVILNKIDGVWQPSAYGEPKEDITDISAFDGKWDFMYLMAYCDHYFCNKDQTPVTFQQFEEAIRAYYYGKNDPLNSNPNYDTVINNARVENNYFQVTSWDFMGPKIGGLRPGGNAIACTQYYTDPSGVEIETPYIDANASNPFFGCVFPDGYDLGLKWGEYSQSAHDVLFQHSDYNNLEYMKTIAEDDNIFENQNVNLAARNAGGMFILGNSTVPHLPADIALNASPSGENGSSLKTIYALKYLSTLHSSNPRVDIDTWFFTSDQKRRGVWMTYGTDKYNSVFDFSPLNPSRLTFRPLKLETYASFEFDSYGGIPPDKNGSYPNLVDWWFRPYSGAVPAENTVQRGLFGCRDWKIMADKQSPIATGALERNANNNYPIPSPYTSQNAPVYTRYNDIYGYKGLRYNVDISKNSARIPSTQAFYPQPIWSKSWQHGGNRGFPGGSGTTFIQWLDSRGQSLGSWYDITPNTRPAGAVGVIGAQCTVTAKEYININCDSYLGVAHWRIGGNDYNASFGTTGGSKYNSFNISTLQARVFHAWPRDLTIYDPRFFAVFHFNPGVGILDDNNENKKYDEYIDGILLEDYEDPPNDVVSSYPDGYYVVEKSECEVDFRVPTSSEVNALGESQSINNPGAIVNSDNIRKKEDSNLDRKRRGQMLPYYYRMFDIGVGAFQPMTLQAYTGFTGYAKDFDYVVLCPGSGYSADDRFFVVGGKGQGVVLKPVLGNPQFGSTQAPNGIIGFQPTTTSLGGEIAGTSPGTGFSSEDFLESNLFINSELPNGASKAIIYDPDGNSIDPIIKIIPSGKPKGQNFDGYIIRGKVILTTTLDKKPIEILSNASLTENLKWPPESEGPLDVPPGLKDTVIDLTQTAKNTDTTFGLQNKYDIFFHFHNDISHTYSYNSINAAYGAGTPRPYEQHATVSVSLK